MGLSVGASDVVQAYQDQVSLLKQDPNATEAFKAALDRQVDAVRSQVALQSGDTQTQTGPQTPLPDPTNVPAPIITSSVNNALPDSLKNSGTSSSTSNGGNNAGSSLGSNLPEALQKLAPDILKAAQVTGEDPVLLAAQVWQESRGQLSANSTNAGTGQSDAGVMQVDAATFVDLQKKHPELQGKSLGDTLTNLEAGSFYEQDMKKQFGSDPLALRAYNSGPGSVDKSNPDATTTGLGDPTYVQKVEKMANDIRNGIALPA